MNLNISGNRPVGVRWTTNSARFAAGTAMGRRRRAPRIFYFIDALNSLHQQCLVSFKLFSLAIVNSTAQTYWQPSHLRNASTAFKRAHAASATLRLHMRRLRVMNFVQNILYRQFSSYHRVIYLSFVQNILYRQFSSYHRVMNLSFVHNILYRQFSSYHCRHETVIVRVVAKFYSYGLIKTGLLAKEWIYL